MGNIWKEETEHNHNLAAELLHYIHDLWYYENWWWLVVFILTELVFFVFLSKGLWFCPEIVVQLDWVGKSSTLSYLSSNLPLMVFFLCQWLNMMRVALLPQLPAMLQPTILLILHPNVMSAHVLAVGSDAATPTELCGKAEFPGQNHGTNMYIWCRVVEREAMP